MVLEGSHRFDIEALKEIIVNLSNFIAANSNQIDQVEMNPVLVSDKQVIALDALIITK